jgi:hypothetical protein
MDVLFCSAVRSGAGCPPRRPTCACRRPSVSRNKSSNSTVLGVSRTVSFNVGARPQDPRGATGLDRHPAPQGVRALPNRRPAPPRRMTRGCRINWPTLSRNWRPSISPKRMCARGKQRGAARYARRGTQRSAAWTPNQNRAFDLLLNYFSAPFTLQREGCPVKWLAILPLVQHGHLRRL